MGQAVGPGDYPGATPKLRKVRPSLHHPGPATEVLLSYLHKSSERCRVLHEGSDTTAARQGRHRCRNRGAIRYRANTGTRMGARSTGWQGTEEKWMSQQSGQEIAAP